MTKRSLQRLKLFSTFSEKFLEDCSGSIKVDTELRFF